MAIVPDEAGLGLGEAPHLRLNSGRGLTQFPLPPPLLPGNKKLEIQKNKSHAADAALDAARLHLINKITADVYPGDCIIGIPAVSELSAALFSHWQGLCLFIILIAPEGVVDKGVFHKGGEHEADTNALPDINSLGIGHGRQCRVDGGCLQGEDHDEGYINDSHSYKPELTWSVELSLPAPLWQEQPEV